MSNQPQTSKVSETFEVSSPNTFKPTELGDLPAGWEVVQLGEVTLTTETRDPRKKPDKRFRYIDVASVSNETYRVVSPQSLIGCDAPSRARKVVWAGDTIFATVRPYLRNIAQVPSYLDNEICSTGFCIIRANSKRLNPDFLFNVAISNRFVEHIVAQQRGSSYPAVSDKVVFETPIPLPPLDEQRRIARVLNAVQQAIAAQDDLIAAAQEVKRSLMRRLFTYGPGPEPAPTKETEIGEVPEHWGVVRLGEISSFSRKPRSLDIAQYKAIPFIPMEFVPEDGIDITHHLTLKPEDLRSGTYCEKGDILLDFCSLKN